MIKTIGVFGTLIEDKNLAEIQKSISYLFKQLHEKHRQYVWVVSDCLDTGVPKIAFSEALKYGWYTIGVHSPKVNRYPIFITDHFIAVSDDNDLNNFLKEILSILIYDINDPRAKRIAQALMEVGIQTIGLGPY